MRALIFGLAALTACADKGTDTAATLDTGPCADVPLVTWENFGHSLLTESCDSCHAATSDNRNGAPEDVHFDSFEELVAQSDRVLARATGDDPTMPPEGGVTEDDRALLAIWLTCWLDVEQGI